MLGCLSSPLTEESFRGEIEVPKMRHMQRELVSQALQQTRGNKRQAALLLGISRATLWRKLRSYGLG